MQVKELQTTISNHLKRLNRPQIAALASLGLLIFYTLVGFFVVPPVLKYLLQKDLSERLQRKATIEKVYANPFTLALQVDGFRLQGKDHAAGDVASFKSLYVNLQAVSVAIMAPVVKEITLIDPYFKIVRIDQDRFNISDLLSTGDSGAKETGRSSPARFSLHDVQIENGKLEIVDRPLRQTHSITQINLTVPQIDSMKADDQAPIEPTLSARIGGSSLEMHGELAWFPTPGPSTATIDVQNINLPDYSAYFPPQLRAKVSSGQLNVNLRIRYTPSERQAASVQISGNGELNHLKVSSPQGANVLTLDKLALSIAEYDLLAGRLHIAKAEFDSPNLSVARDSAGHINLASLYVADKKASGKPQVPSQSAANKPLRVVVDELQVAGGKLAFADSPAAGPFKTTLFPINLTVKNFSSAPDSPRARITLAADTEAGESVAWDGSLSLEPLAAAGNLKLSKLFIPKYAPYFRNMFQCEVRDSRVDLAMDVQYAKTDSGQDIRLSHLKSAVKSLQLRMKQANKDFLDIGSIALAGGQLDLGKKRLTIDQVSSRQGSIHLIRRQDGTLNLAELLPESSPAAPTRQKPQASGDDTAWQVAVKDLHLSDYAITAEDLSTPSATVLTAKELQLGLQNFSTEAGNINDASLSFVLNEAGQISLAGKFQTDPLAADLDVNLKAVGVAKLEPYYRDYVKVHVTGGELSAAGKLVFDQRGQGDPEVSYSGDFALNNFTSVPTVAGQEIVKWETFALSGISAGNNPRRLKIDKVDLVGFTSYIRINPDGSINFRQVLKGEQDRARPIAAPNSDQSRASAAPAGSVQSPETPKAGTGSQPTEAAVPNPGDGDKPLSIEIGQIALQNGDIDFTDNLIEPHFHASFHDATGTISGLSSQPEARADVQIKAKIEEYAPAEISGKVNPLSKDLFTDLTLAASNIDMTLTNPYAEKFAGYHIKKGKLSFNFHYKIEHGDLDARHRIEFSNLTLGDKVDSPDAADIPLKFAISLLQDRHGDIVLDVPVSGKISDPKFDFTQVIKTAVTNLLKKIVTAPFALLGAIFGGGGDGNFSYVEFHPGTSEITAEAAKKLAVVAKALYERPKLELEVTGYVDRRKDRRALLEQKLKQPTAEQAAEDAGGSVADPAAANDRTGGKRANAGKSAAAGPRPATAAAPSGASPPAKANATETAKPKVTVTAKELKELARKRAKTVRDYIVKTGKIKAERIYIVAPQSLEPAKKEAPIKSCALLMLK